MSNFASKRHGKTLEDVSELGNPCAFEYMDGLNVVVYTYERKLAEIVAFGRHDTSNGWWRDDIRFDSAAQISELLQALREAMDSERRGTAQDMCKLDLHTNCLLVRRPAVKDEEEETDEFKKTKSELVIPPVGPDVHGCDPKDYQRIVACALVVERLRNEEERRAREDDEEEADSTTVVSVD